MQSIIQQTHATQAQPVFAVIYVEGSPVPVFKGLTSLALTSEKVLRSMLLTMFPAIRKAAIAVLGVSTRDLPDFMRRTEGHLLFSQELKEAVFLKGNRVLAQIVPFPVRKPKISRPKAKKKLKGGHSTRRSKMARKVKAKAKTKQRR